MTTTLIVSDIHLGSGNCHPAQLLRLLQHLDYDRLILNGDTINGLNLKKLKPKHWLVVGKLREIAMKKELILIRGNHEGLAKGDEAFGPLDVLATLLDVEMHEEFRLEVNGERYLVLHGDRFDPTLSWPIVTDAADWCYHTTQKINKKAAKWLKHRVKKLGGVVEFVRQRSVQYARDLGYKGVITGHTHFPDDEWIDDIHYLNTGCWVDKPCTYVLATEDRVFLSHWEEPKQEATQLPAVTYAS